MAAKLAAAALLLELLGVVRILDVVEGTLQWVALTGAAGATMWQVYKRILKPVFTAASAAVDVTPLLQSLPERLAAGETHFQKIDGRLEQHGDKLDQIEKTLDVIALRDKHKIQEAVAGAEEPL